MEPKLLVILFTSCGASAFRLLDTDQINLGQELEIFSSCVVNIVANYLKDTAVSEVYELPALDFPIIQSKNTFILKPNTDHKSDATSPFRCNGVPYQLDTHINGFTFRAPPSSRHHCYAEIYIEPIPCFSWQHQLDPPYDKHLFTNKIPASYLDPLYDFRLSEVSVYTVKSSIFFIWISSPKSSFINNLGLQYGSRYVALVDYLWTRPINLTLKNSVRPTKLWFKVSHTSKTVDKTVKLTCHGYGNFTTALLEDSESTNTLKQLILLWKLYAKEKPKRIAYASSQIHSLIQLQNLWHECDNNIVFQEDAPIFKNKTGSYFIHFTQANRFSPESVFLSILCSNSTFLVGNIFASSYNMHPMFRFIKKPHISSKFIHHDTEPLKFITCAPVGKPGVLSLLGYISSFDLATWITLILMGIRSRLIIHIGYDKHAIKLNRDVLWQFGTYVYNTLLGMESAQLNRARWLSGSWLIAGIILSYYYKGDNIDKIISPVPRTRLDTFDKLLNANFTIYSTTAGFEYVKTAMEYAEQINNIFPTVSVEQIYKIFELNDILFAKWYVRKNFKTPIDEAWKQVAKMVNMPKTDAEVLNYFSTEYIASQIGHCDKEAYVDSIENVNKLGQDLEVSGISKESITTSVDTYGEVFDVWEFDNFDWTSAKLNTRVGSLFQSGIVAAWKRWVSRITSWNDTIWQHRRHSNRNELKGISLEDNAVVVFYIHLFLSVVAAFAFLYEIWDKVLRACKSGYKYVCVSLREFGRVFKRSFCRGRKISFKRGYAVNTIS